MQIYIKKTEFIDTFFANTNTFLNQLTFFCKTLLDGLFFSINDILY